MKSINNLKNSFFVDKKRSFIDDDDCFVGKNYQNIMRFRFVWNKQNNNNDKLFNMQKSLRNNKHY